MQPQLFTDAVPAIADLSSGATVMVGGQNGVGVPTGLLRALTGSGTGQLTLICEADCTDLLGLVSTGQVRKLVCPPISQKAWKELQGKDIVIESLAAGLLSERIRAAGAGIGSFLLQPLPGLSQGDNQSPGSAKERQVLDGQEYVVESPLRADFALLRAHKADTLGNLVYEGAARNWNPNMATAANVVVVEVDEVVEPGDLDPESVISPGIFIDRIVCGQLPASQ